MGVPAQTLLLKDGRTGLVRAAEPRDAEAWIEHINAVGAERVFLFTETFGHSLEEVREQFRTADPAEVLWLAAEVDGRLVGAADFRRGRRPKSAHTATLGLSVRKPYRELGLGEGMLRAGIAWAHREGIRKLRLGVFATNERAISLYRKLGFSEEGRLRAEAIIDGEPVDEILMALFLTT